MDLRERARQAMRVELAHAAFALFRERGFDAVTVDDIAAAAGMSKRSVFRYFATKEDIVVGKFDLARARMLDNLRARPAGEAVWASLRRMFDNDLWSPEEMKATLRVIHETPVLIGTYLSRLQGTQDVLVAALVERAGDPPSPDEATLRALTAAAFGCMTAAQASWLASDGPEALAPHLDHAMGALAENR